MKIWELKASKKSIIFSLDRAASNEWDLFTFHFKSKPMTSRKPVQFKVYRLGSDKDFPWMSPGVLILSKKAMNVLDDLVSPSVEYLKVDHTYINEQEVVVVNVLTTVQPEKSSDEDNIYFESEELKDIHIFKTTIKSTRIYVSDEFRDLVLKFQLKGLEFNEIWDSEVTEEMKIVQEQKYEAMLADIERNKGQEFNWNEAIEMVNSGKSMASGKWKLQAEADGNVLMGQLEGDGTYYWMNPIYYPPILLDLMWHEVEKSVI